MKENTEIAFESVLRCGGPFEITDICQRDHITYFKINGHQFQTYDCKIHHRGSPMYDCPVSKIWAEQSHDPEAIAKKDEMMDRINTELGLWYKHRLSVFKIVFLLASEVLVTEGDEAYLKFIDDHFHITAEAGAETIMKMLESKSK